MYSIKNYEKEEDALILFLLLLLTSLIGKIIHISPLHIQGHRQKGCPDTTGHPTNICKRSGVLGRTRPAIYREIKKKRKGQV